MWFFVVTLFAALVGLAPVHAASLSGVVLYTADDFGMPSGQDSFDRPENPEAHLWRTLASGRWHSLVLYEGLPPESLKRRPLNSRNLAIDIPLTEGENYFTIVGEPGPITATDQYQRFALNLYFDGELEQPGISVLFPRYADFDGGPTASNRSLYIYSFNVTPSQVRSPGVDDTGLDFYDDGLERVSVTSASFLAAERSEVSVDQVGPQSVGSSGTDDFIGSVTLLVEPSEGTSGGAIGDGTGGVGGVPRAGGAPRAPAAIVPRGGGAAPIITGPSGGGQLPAPQAEAYQAPAAAAAEDDEVWVGGDATPTPRDAINALKNWLQDAVEPTESSTETAGTPTPAATPAATTRTSPSPKTTAAAATATAARSPAAGTGGSRTTTPAVTPTPTNTRATMTPSPLGSATPATQTPKPPAKQG